MTVKAIDVFMQQPWAIAPEWMDTLHSIAARENEYAGNLDALEKKLGRPLGNTMTATVRDGVAVIPVEGPLLAKANLFSKVSGATSYDVLATDLQAALDNPEVKSILLHINSPGGSVAGVSQLAQYIRDARQQKPVHAFVGDQAASAGYWLAAQAETITAADTAMIGSIGVQMSLTKGAQPDGEKSLRFISSNAPLKNADPETDAGAAEVQRVVNDIEQVFLQAVADGRDTTVENVLAQYGQGAVFVAAEAKKRGMIDGIGTYELVLMNLSQKGTSMELKSLTAEKLAAERPDIVEAIKAEALAGVEKVDANAIRSEAAAAERARILGIEALAMPGADALIAELKADATATPETAAIKVLQHLKANPAAAITPAAGTANAGHIAHLRDTEAKLDKVPTAEGEGKAMDDADKLIADAQAAGAI